MSDLLEVTLTLCHRCLDGEGSECHAPGCALWMNRAPDVPIRDKAEVALRSRIERVEAENREFRRILNLDEVADAELAVNRLKRAEAAQDALEVIACWEEDPLLEAGESTALQFVAFARRTLGMETDDE